MIYYDVSIAFQSSEIASERRHVARRAQRRRSRTRRYQNRTLQWRFGTHTQ